MNRNFFMLIFFSVLGILSYDGPAQEPADSAKILEEFRRRLNELERRIDSLTTELNNSKDLMVTRSDFESILRSVNEDDQEFTDENRRSKRKALDSLFRAALHMPGELTLTGQFLSVLQWDGKFDNAINTVVATVDLFAISSLSKNSLVFINLQGVAGDGPGKNFSSFNGFHAGAGSTQSPEAFDRINIWEAWIEYKLKHTSVTAGKIDLTNYFDPNSVANDEYSQFISNGFVNNAAFAVPGNGPGLVINSGIVKGYSVLVGISSNDNRGAEIFEDLFAIFQVGKAFNIRDDEVGAIRFFAYNNSFSRNEWGFGVSADLKLTDRLYAYGRYGKNLDSVAVSLGINDAYSAGLQLRNCQVHKSLEVTVGAAYAITKPSTLEINDVNEKALEAYVRLNVKNAFFISPHFQLIADGAGTKGQNVSVYGLRIKVAF